MPEIDELPSTRPGTYADLSRRMDRMEQRHETLEVEVRTLASTVSRVEMNQNHAVELNKLRFDALDTGLKSIGGQLTDFTKRMEGILSGEVETAQGRQGAALVADYVEWRKAVDRDRDAQAVINGQMRLLGRLAVLLTIGGGVTTVCSIVALAITLANA